MKNAKRLLFISNGHGEDQAAALIIKKLMLSDSCPNITVMPIVGEGKAFDGMGLEVADAGARLPSGGFARLGPGNLIKDLKKGLVSQTLNQIRILKKMSQRTEMVVACGDVFLLLLAGLFVRKPVVFYAAAKSEYINGHFYIERLIMRALALKVFTRDSLTAAALGKQRIPAFFAGNPVMDAAEACESDMRRDMYTVGFLPGSREDAYSNILFFLEIVEKMSEAGFDCKICFNISFFEGLSLTDMERKLDVGGSGWRLHSAVTGDKNHYKLIKGDIEALLFIGRFEELLCGSDIIVGLSGTGNEQAAGCGKPIVAFPSKGNQYNERFMASQKKLLGRCMEIVRPVPEEAADKVFEILGNSDLYKAMSEEGTKRMGMKGGSGRIAEDILKLL